MKVPRVRQGHVAAAVGTVALTLVPWLAGLAQVPPLETAPPPRPFDVLPGPGCLDQQATGERVLGSAPQPNAETLKQFGAFVQQTIDPQNTFDLVVGQPRLLVFKETPFRIQLGDDRAAAYQVITQRELSLYGKAPGSTVLNLWFGNANDPKQQTILSYLVRVLPNPIEKVRLETQLKTLQDDINRKFCDSVVCLSLVGNKVVISGEAKDIVEAGQIVSIVGVQTGGSGSTTAANRPGQGTQGLQATQLPPTTTPATPTPPESATPEGAAATAGALATPTAASYLVPNFPNLINLLRVPGEQEVMLKVVVAEVNRDAARSIGVNFMLNNNKGQTVFSQLTGPLGSGTSQSSAGIGGTGTQAGAINLPMTLDNGKLPVFLNALRSLDLAKTLAEPDLVTLNGKAANFQAGGSFPIPTLATAGGVAAQGVQFVNVGVQLQFTPIITDRNRIRLQVNANVSDVDPSLSTAIGNGAGSSTVVNGTNTRNFSTTVEMRDGQTLAVAGLVRNDFLSHSDRVPGLGDIPIFSRLWSVNTTSYRDQELIMLVTPVLVHPLAPKELPPLPGADVFEPGDLEFYLLGRMESRRSYDYRSSARDELSRMIRYRQCENIYITGPHGHSDGK